MIEIVELVSRCSQPVPGTCITRDSDGGKFIDQMPMRSTTESGHVIFLEAFNVLFFCTTSSLPPLSLFPSVKPLVNGVLMDNHISLSHCGKYSGVNMCIWMNIA